MIYYKTKDDIPIKYRWDITGIVKDKEELNQLIDKYKEMVDELSKIDYSSKIHNFFKLYYEIEVLQVRLYKYYHLLYIEDIKNGKYLDEYNRLNEINDKYASLNDKFNEYIISLSDEEYNKIINNPEIQIYIKDLKNIRKSKNKSNNPSIKYEIEYNKIKDSINEFRTINIDGDEVKITKGNQSKYFTDSNRDIRKESYEKYRSAYSKYENEFANYLNGFIKSNNEIAKQNGFDNYIEYVLSKQDINVDIIKPINDVYSNLNVTNKYYSLLKDKLDVDKLKLYDVDINLEEIDDEISIEEAQDLCLESIKPLGEDYYNHFKKIFDNHYINYLYYEGRSTGSYNYPFLDRDGRILLTYNYDIESVYKMIHECGHHVNHQLVNDNNIVNNRKTHQLITEISSLTNELLLSIYLIKNNKYKKYAINKIVNIINDYFFGSIKHMNFLLDIYEKSNNGIELTSNILNETMEKHAKHQYGDDFEPDIYSNQLWILKGMYFRDFYFLSYIVGIAVAVYIIEKLNQGDKNIIDKYLLFLSTGSNKNIDESLKILDIDITNNDIFINTINYYDKILNEYIELINREGELNGK